MKKKIWLPIVIGILLLGLLFVPIHSFWPDGGSEVYSAVLYRVVKWNTLSDSELNGQTRVYWFPNNLKDMDALWEREVNKFGHSVYAAVTEINGSTVTAEPLEGCSLRDSSDLVTFSAENLTDIGAGAGSFVKVIYKDLAGETYPAQINAVDWELIKDLRLVDCPRDAWIDKTNIKPVSDRSEDLAITRIYRDCFFASCVWDSPYEYKINGTLSEDWCIGDRIRCTFTNIYFDSKEPRLEADLVSVESEITAETEAKPVIYLYPTQETEVSVELELRGELTCTYPAYKEGWTVIASPDGTLTDKNGKTYNYLYWEAETYADFDLSQGFCIKGEDTAVFLEQALADLGLTRREANEFIVYWLPLMEDNPYNIISFQTEAYTDTAKLHISPAPDTLIRVFMAWHAADEFTEIPPQSLTAPQRTGFTVIEWGGTELK